TGRAGMAGEAISLACPEDNEGLAAIEKLIKKKIERVLVPGFTSAGTVANMMGSERRRDRDGDRERGRERDREGRRGDRHPQPQPSHSKSQSRPLHSSAPRPQQKPSDPIFSAPYEPGTAP